MSYHHARVAVRLGFLIVALAGPGFAFAQKAPKDVKAPKPLVDYRAEVLAEQGLIRSRFGSSIAGDAKVTIVADGWQKLTITTENGRPVYAAGPWEDSVGIYKGKKIAAQIPAPEEANGHGFGKSLAYSQGLLAVGAENSSGTVYLYQLDKKYQPTPLLKITAPEDWPVVMAGGLHLGSGLLAITSQPGQNYSNEPGRMAIYDIPGGELRHMITLPAGQSFSGQVRVAGPWVVAGVYGRTYMPAEPGWVNQYDAATGELVRTFGANVRGMTVDESAARLAVVSDGVASETDEVNLYDLGSGAHQQTILLSDNLTNQEQVELALLGKNFAVSSYGMHSQTAGAVYIYDLQQGTKTKNLIPPLEYTAARFGMGLTVLGKKLAVGARNAIHFYPMK